MPTYSLSDLIFRVPLGREMTDVEHDTNLAVLAYMISIMAGGEGAVQSVNGQAGAVVLDATDVGALAASALTDINAAIAAKADASALAAKANTSDVNTALAAKVGTGDSRLTDRRVPAAGDYGAVTFALVGGVIVASLLNTAVRDSLGTLVAENRLDQSKIKGFTSSNFGALVQQAIIAAIGGVAGQVLGQIALVNGVLQFTAGASSPISQAKLAEYLTGTNANLLVSVGTARYMGKIRTKAYSATMTLRLDGKRIMDGDDHDSDGLSTKVIDVSGNVALNFQDIHAGLEGEGWRVRLVSNTAGARTISVATANGITVELAPGVTIPSLGANVGDAVDIVGTVVSSTLVRVERCVLDPA